MDNAKSSADGLLGTLSSLTGFGGLGSFDADVNGPGAMADLIGGDSAMALLSPSGGVPSRGSAFIGSNGFAGGGSGGQSRPAAAERVVKVEIERGNADDFAEKVAAAVVEGMRNLRLPDMRLTIGGEEGTVDARELFNSVRLG